MENPHGKLRWGQEQRLEFIEFRLFWEGGINRSDIIGRFRVSEPQASTDLTSYREKAPDNMLYDSSAKRYVASPLFVPRLHKPNPDRYLAQLKAMADDVIDIDDTWMGEPPSAETMPVPARKVDPVVLRTLVSVIREHRSIKVEYYSMNEDRPDGLWRWITPHAFGHDGMRWHIRAFCHLQRRFKDFLLSRCRHTGEKGEAEASAIQDTDWNSFFDVILIPNPGLSAGQRQAVAWDYNMLDGKVRVPVRKALLYYFNKRLRLDVADKLDKIKERPVIVANESEYKQALISATT